jgi:alpha-galactosidase
MRAKGARPGIWIRYLSDQAGQTPGVTDDMRMSRDTHFLDPTHPAVREQIVQDTLRIVNEWGYELIKHDFSTFDLFGRWGRQAQGFLAEDGWHFYDRSKTSAEITVDLYRLIREAAGDAIVLGCNVIGHLAAGLVEMNRTGNDTSGRDWERTRKMGVNTLAFHMMHHKTFYDVDADCVGVMGLIPWEQNREWLRALAVSGTPLFVSYDPKLPPDEQAYADLTAAFTRSAAQEDQLIPLDWMDNTCPERWLLNGEEISFRWIV